MLKSLTAYQLTIPTTVLLERLPAALESKPFAKCQKKQPRSRGFIAPLGAGEILYSANGGTLFCLRTDEKTVPASAVKELVEERREKAIKAGGDFSKVDERVAKEEITEAFLPGIPCATSLTYAYIDNQLHMMFLGATGDAADEFIKFMGDALKGTPFMLLGIEADPCDKFTAWVRDTDLLGHAFTLGDIGAIKHAGTEGGCGIINLKHEDFESSEILTLIENNRQVCSIALEHERMNFRLTSTLGLRNIAVSDDVKAQGFDEETDSTTLPNEFAAFVVALRAVMGSLEPLLGGWPKQEVLDLQDKEAAA